MLQRFEVENFKGFREKLIFDLSARDYAYNAELVKNGIVNKALVYGKNGTGKSNLGIALFDIIYHLTDTQRMPAQYLVNYLNLQTGKPEILFRYQFCFDNDIVDYSYAKISVDDLLYEKLDVNGQNVLYFDYRDRSRNYMDMQLAGLLNFDLLIDNKLSVIKFIYKNTPTNTVPYISRLVSFCEGMLWYRSLSDGNMYSGLSTGRNRLSEILYESGKLSEFREFLKQNGIDYDLKFENVNGSHELMVCFAHGKAPFDMIASTGTNTLLLFFTWSLYYKRVKFLFIDEFDAFLHYESASELIKFLNRQTLFQTVVTTHNTYLMQNSFTRPDRCFIMTGNRVKNLCSCTRKEIREAHNLEKMYINGAFSNEQ